MEVPVYLFTGFIDSGKTSLISETIFLNGFISKEIDKFLIISCEDGDEKITDTDLSHIGGTIVHIEEEEDFNAQKLMELNSAHNPKAVFIEYNGTWSVDKIFNMKEFDNWAIAQTLCTINCETFEMYMQNMRQMMAESIKMADVIIFNRYENSFSKAKFRANIRSINKMAQIIYERTDHSIDESKPELPFDLSKECLEISDTDYALWFMDCMDNPEKYDGKIVSFLALVYNPTTGNGQLRGNTFVPGRFAMTCCADDIQFLGLMCKYKDSSQVKHKSWVNLKARIKCKFTKEYSGVGPVLYPIEIMPANPPEEELVYFT